MVGSRPNGGKWCEFATEHKQAFKFVLIWNLDMDYEFAIGTGRFVFGNRTLLLRLQTKN